MMTEEERLSKRDVELLTKGEDVESKIKIVEKLSSYYSKKEFSDNELKLAEEIFRLLTTYAEIGVRKSLAENLMTADFVPRDILLSLAKDIEDVSSPILEFSELLNEDDLIDIIHTTENTDSQVAIARRETLSEAVSGALVDTSKGDVVETLLENSGAKISEASFEKVIEDFSDKEGVIEALVTRGSIPPSIVREVTNKVSNVIQKKLETKYKCSFTEIHSLFQESGEIAAFRFGNMKIFGDELIELINILEQNDQLEKALDPLHGKLTFLLNEIEPIGEFIPISAIAMGNKTIFEICMSRITGVKYSNIKKLVSDLDSGLKALYEKAKLPDSLFDAARFAIWVINKMDEEAAKFSSPRASEDLHEYVRNIISLSKGKKIRNLSSFISIIRKHIDRQHGEW